MISLIQAGMDKWQLGEDISAFERLLTEHDQLEETGPNGLQEFFAARPGLLLLMSQALFAGLRPAGYLAECSILHEFRADYVIANAERSRFLFVEFEHAKENSIFSMKAKTKSHRSYQWSRTVEHGFSQVVDWYFRLDDYHKTSKIEEHFGVPKIEYVGVLIVGRDQFLNQAGLMQRFDWRRECTVINNRKLRCFTFDQLARELRGTYAMLVDLKPADFGASAGH